MLSRSSRLSATATADGRLDKVLALAFPHLSRSRFQGLIADGHARVEGKVEREGRSRVRAGQALEVDIPDPEPAAPLPEHLSLDIVFEDMDVIVINKPAGLVVHPGAGNPTGTLVNALIAHCGESLSGIGGVKRPGIVHRLDKDTTGLLVVAKNDPAHHALSQQFAAHGRDGRLHRTYQAVIWGAPERPRGTISASLARSTANRKKIAISRASSSRQAVTHYQVLETFGSPPVASLVQCQLETGRTHQIRVHMAHIGHPLLGDATYGAGFKSSATRLPPAARSALTALGRQALHAQSLGFEHPRTGRALKFDAPLPHDLAMLLTGLREGDTVT